MAITLEKIEEAQNKLNEVQQRASELNEILVKVREAILRNPDGTVKIDLTSIQKTSLLAEYDSRKTALITAINNLL